MKKLKIHSLENSWCDRDKLLLHADFQILVDYVDKESPGTLVDWNSSKELKKAWDNICNLYEWWTKKRPEIEHPLEDIYI